MEEGEVGDGRASQHFVEKRQVVVASRHDGDGGRAGHTERFLNLGDQFGFYVGKTKQPRDDPIEEGAGRVRP